MEFAKVEDDHFIHVGENADGEPCNSSVSPAWMQGFDDEESRGYWRCLGCGAWWPDGSMPHDMESEGLSALRHMR